IDVKTTLKGWEGHEQHRCAVLDGGGTMSSSPDAGGGAAQGMKVAITEGHLSGHSWFDPELGALVDWNGDQAMKANTDMPAPAGHGARLNITSDIKQKVSLKLVELRKGNS